MPDKALYQMMSAYAAGCLDMENYIQFKNYIIDRGDLPSGEMGELQNVLSLIPTLLDQEKPSPAVKEKIAKRLMELKDETKSKIKEERITAESKKQTDTVKQEETIDLKKLTTAQEKEQKKFDVKSLHDTMTRDETRLGPKTKMRTQQIQTPEKSSSLVWILTGTLIVILIAVIFYFYETNKSLENEISDIKEQLSGFQNEIANTNEFINDHLSLIEFFNYSDVDIVNFIAADPGEKGSARLIISFAAGEGLVQFKNVQSITSNEAYQLWMVSKDVSYSLGVFVIMPEIKYYKVSNFPNIPKEQIDLFRITKENRGGSEIPSGATYLFGTLKMEKTTTRRR